MVVQDMNYEGLESSFKQGLIHDQRVQYEFGELTQLLKEIAAQPVNDCMVMSDPSWPINDLDVSRWVITLEGKVSLNRIAQFRQMLESRDDVIDARVDSAGGRIAIRLVTTGGIPMGPVEQAIAELKDDTIAISEIGVPL